MEPGHFINVKLWRGASFVSCSEHWTEGAWVCIARGRFEVPAGIQHYPARCLFQLHRLMRHAELLVPSSDALCS